MRSTLTILCLFAVLWQSTATPTCDTNGTISSNDTYPPNSPYVWITMSVPTYPPFANFTVDFAYDVSQLLASHYNVSLESFLPFVMIGGWAEGSNTLIDPAPLIILSTLDDSGAVAQVLAARFSSRVCGCDIWSYRSSAGCNSTVPQSDLFLNQARAKPCDHSHHHHCGYNRTIVLCVLYLLLFPCGRGGEVAVKWQSAREPVDDQRCSLDVSSVSRCLH
jgi:hypothetical protein